MRLLLFSSGSSTKMPLERQCIEARLQKMDFPGMNDSKYLNIILLLLSKQPFPLSEIKTKGLNG